MTRALLAVAALALSACASPALAPRAPAAGEPSFSITSYNVETGKADDPSVIEAVGAARSDVACLQEITPDYEKALRARWTARYPHQLYHHNAPDFGAGGLAVLSRFPLVDRGHHRSPYRWHPAWLVEVETPSGPIQVVNLHLRAKLSGRGNDLAALWSLRRDHLREIRHFMRFTRKGPPTLVVGDFNEEAGGAALGWLEARGYRNTLPLFQPGAHTWRYPVLGFELRQTLDHVLHDEAFVPLDAEVIHAGSSDHLPVAARLALRSRPPSRALAARR